MVGHTGRYSDTAQANGRQLPRLYGGDDVKSS